MHNRHRFSFIAAIFLVTSCATPHPIITQPAPVPTPTVQPPKANIIKSPKLGYSFKFPDNWRPDAKEKNYMVRGEAQESLSDFDAPPNNSSLDLNVSANQAIALASGFCGKVLSENHMLSGNQWSGNYFVCSKSNGKTKQQTAEIFYTVKHRNDYFLFWLSVPSQAWSNRSNTYVSILQSLQFGNP